MYSAPGDCGGAGVAPHATQSVLTCRDEDMTDMSNRAKVQKTDSDVYECRENLVTESQSKTICRRSKRQNTAENEVNTRLSFLFGELVCGFIACCW